MTSTRRATPPPASGRVAPDGTRVPISVVHRRDLDLPAPCRALRVRRLRDLHRPVVLAPPPVPARPRRRLRHRARARRRRDGPRLVRGRADGAQGQHVLRLHRLRAPPGGGRDRPAGRAGRPGRLGRWPAHRRRGQPGPRALPRPGGPGPLRRLRHHHARRRAPPDGGRVGGVGQPAGRRVGLLAHARRTRPTTTSPARTRTGRSAPTPTCSSPAASTTPASPTGSRPSGWPSCGPSRRRPGCSCAPSWAPATAGRRVATTPGRRRPSSSPSSSTRWAWPEAEPRAARRPTPSAKRRVNGAW